MVYNIGRQKFGRLAHSYTPRLCATMASALLTLSVCPALAEARLARIDYKGWRGCYELTNPLVRVVIVPQIGGRVMEYSIAGECPIWQNKAELGVVRPWEVGRKWHNYGGHKAWNAPQQNWRAPDLDNFYDYAPAKAEPIETTDSGEKMIGVRVTCDPIPRLGLQFVREVYLAQRTSRVRLVETMRNVCDREVEWGIWGVTQVNAPCWVAFPLDLGGSGPDGWRRLLPADEFPDPHSVTRTGSVGVMKYPNAIDKIGTGSLDGWMVYLRDQLAYVKQWSVRTVDAVYPDEGCNMEVFAADKAMGGYVEMEVLGPVVKLRPGEATQLTEDWFLSRVNQSASDPADVVERLKLLRHRGLLPRSAKF